MADRSPATPEARQALVDAACKLADSLGVDYLELRNLEPLPDWPTKTQYVTFRKPIVPDPEANLKAVPRKQRAMIRKGIKADLVAEIDANAGRLYATLSECKRNLGTPFFGRQYLDAIVETFPGQAEILTVTRHGETVCSVMSFRFRNEILPYYGGGGELARKYKGNDFMYWAVMERACQSGVEVFDYGRSTAGTGPYSFKKNWGFEPQPLYYQYYLVKADSRAKPQPDECQIPAFHQCVETICHCLLRECSGRGSRGDWDEEGSVVPGAPYAVSTEQGRQNSFISFAATPCCGYTGFIWDAWLTIPRTGNTWANSMSYAYGGQGGMH